MRFVPNVGVVECVVVTAFGYVLFGVANDVVVVESGVVCLGDEVLCVVYGVSVVSIFCVMGFSSYWFPVVGAVLVIVSVLEVCVCVIVLFITEFIAGVIRVIGFCVSIVSVTMGGVCVIVIGEVCIVLLISLFIVSVY